MNLVSVIIPFFNSEMYLHRAIDSVIYQSYENWEIVLIDDGSSDGSINVANKYAEIYPPKIRVFRQENRGCGIARNKGISEANGSYIALLDSDDEWDKDFLKKILAAFDSCQNVDVVYANAERVDESKNILNRSVFDDDSSVDFRNLSVIKYGKLNVIDDPGILIAVLTSTIKCGSNSIFKRRVFEKVSYHEFLFIEDRILNIFAITAGFRYGYVDEKLIRLYHHGNNSSMIEYNLDKQEKFLCNAIKGYEFMKSNVILNREEISSLRKMLSNYYLDYASTLMEARRGYHRQAALIFKSIYVYPKNNRLYSAMKYKVKNIFRF